MFGVQRLNDLRLHLRSGGNPDQLIRMPTQSGLPLTLEGYRVTLLGYVSICSDPPAFEALQLLVQAGAGLNSGGITPLEASMVSASDAATKFLLQAGANPNKGRCTPLFIACTAGNLVKTQLLIEHGAHLVTPRYSALAQAARAGHTDVLHYLLNKCTSRDYQRLKGKAMRTLVHDVVEGGIPTAAVAKMLFAAVNIDMRNGRGKTALQEAFTRNATFIGRFLIKHGAVLIHAPDDKQALLFLNGCGQPALLYKHFQKLSSPSAPLKKKIQYGSEAVMATTDGRTMHFWRTRLSPEVIEAMVESTYTEFKINMLHVAAGHGKELSQLAQMIAMGFRCKQQSTNGSTPADFARREGYIMQADLLVNAEKFYD